MCVRPTDSSITSYGPQNSNPKHWLNGKSQMFWIWLRSGLPADFLPPPKFLTWLLWHLSHSNLNCLSESWKALYIFTQSPASPWRDCKFNPRPRSRTQRNGPRKDNASKICWPWKHVCPTERFRCGFSSPVLASQVSAAVCLGASDLGPSRVWSMVLAQRANTSNTLKNFELGEAAHPIWGDSKMTSMSVESMFYWIHTQDQCEGDYGEGCCNVWRLNLLPVTGVSHLSFSCCYPCVSQAV